MGGHLFFLAPWRRGWFSSIQALVAHIKVILRGFSISRPQGEEKLRFGAYLQGDFDDFIKANVNQICQNFLGPTGPEIVINKGGEKVILYPLTMFFFKVLFAPRVGSTPGEMF